RAASWPRIHGVPRPAIRSLRTFLLAGASGRLAVGLLLRAHRVWLVLRRQRSGLGQLLHEPGWWTVQRLSRPASAAHEHCPARPVERVAAGVVAGALEPLELGAVRAGEPEPLERTPAGALGWDPRVGRPQHTVLDWPGALVPDQLDQFRDARKPAVAGPDVAIDRRPHRLRRKP